MLPSQMAGGVTQGDVLRGDGKATQVEAKWRGIKIHAAMKMAPCYRLGSAEEAVGRVTSGAQRGDVGIYYGDFFIQPIVQENRNASRTVLFLLCL